VLHRPDEHRRTLAKLGPYGTGVTLRPSASFLEIERHNFDPVSGSHLQLTNWYPMRNRGTEIREFRRSRTLLELISAPSAVQGVSDQSLTSIRSNAFSGMGGRAGGFGGLGRLVVETWLATGREDAT